MKFRGPLFFSVLLLTVLVAAYYPKVDNSQKEVVLMRTILNFMSQLHYKPLEVNDDFSERFYDLYLEQIDGYKRFFTQKDLKTLDQYKYQLDDQVKRGDYTLFDTSLEMLDMNLKRTQEYYRELLSKPFDYTRKEYVELDPDKRKYPENEAALKEFWRKYLKYETLSRLQRKLKSQEDAGEEERKSQQELEKESRAEVLERYDEYYDRLFKLRRVDRLSVFINSMLNLYDPHSYYFEPVEKESFDIDFSGKLEGIGARLQTEGDYTKVYEIMPGGPAWKGGELEKDDLIMKVAQGEAGEWEDITGLLTNAVVQKIRGKPGTIVRLYVKKKDGTFDEISIVRDVIIIEETYAKSLVLNGDNANEKIGYIYLPRFYTNFEDPSARTCSEDIKVELEKLKEAGVKGVILDIRNNGGGSLQDVIDMSGLFIEKGPIVQVKSRVQKSEVLADENPKVSYDGPLVVMVNQNSASASEILSAALQDYNRAVIVGENSTYGKGTVQRIFDMDRYVRDADDVKPLGAIKITMQNFYRINGGSVQMKGVTPDIVLPSNFAYITTGEKDKEFAMEWSKIDPVGYDQNVYQISNLDMLKKRSEERVAADPTFEKILENAKRYERLREETSYPINLEAYQQEEAKRDKEAEKYKNLMKGGVIDGVQNLEVDLPNINKNEKNKSMNENFIKSVSKDIYIKETMNILHDMITVK